MIAIELTKQSKFIHKELLNRGFVLARRSGAEVLRIDPALTIKEKDIESFIENFKQVIEKI